MTKKQVEKKIEVAKQRICIDLACGQRKITKEALFAQANVNVDKIIGVDLHKEKGVDVACNLDNYKWAFVKDNSVDWVYCAHFIEHTKDIVSFMEELYRILKPLEKDADGKVISGGATIIAPYYSSIRAWQDPSHVRAISEASFLYYNQEWLKSQGLDHYNTKKANFNFSYGYALDPDFQNKNVELQQYAIKHYINVVNDIHIHLTVIK